jgi:hypothetical protein
MVNNYQSSKLENDNKHEHGEHLVNKKKNPKKDDEHGHYDHL